MNNYTHRTPEIDDRRIEKVVAGVRVTSRQHNNGNVEMVYYSGRPVIIRSRWGHVKQDGAEWWNIQTKDARHSGMLGTMARPFPVMEKTASTSKRGNRKKTVGGYPVGTGGGTSRKLKQKITSMSAIFELQTLK